MSNYLNRILNIRPEEGRKVFMLVLIFFLFITGTTWAETIIESSFYFLAGVSRLSQVFTFHAITAIVATAVYTAFVDQTSNRKLLIAVCATASVTIGAGLLVLGYNQILAYTILYVLVRAVRTSFLIQWWNYASDFYDARASKRIIPVINSASRIAIIFAGLTIPLLDSILSPAAIILLWVITLIMIACLALVMVRVTGTDNSMEGTRPQGKYKFGIDFAPTKNKKDPISYWQNIREGFQYVSSQNYLRWLALSTFLMVIIFGILNYQGGLIFAQQFKTRAEMTDFIGTLNGLTSLIMLPVQLFLFSRIVTRIGVGNANVIYPFGTLLISGSFLISPLSLTSGALAHFDRNTFRYSTQESSNNLLYNAIPARIKGRSRSFIDGLVLPIALLASSALLEIGKLLPASLFLPVRLGIPALAYFICSLVIRNLYSHAMLSVLDQEDYTFLLPTDEEIELTADPAARNYLLKKLAESKDDSVILLIAQIMTETAGTKVLPILEMKARGSPPPLRAGIVDVVSTGEIQSISKNTLVHFFTSFIKDPDNRVRLAAFNGLLRSSDTTSESFLAQASGLLHDENYEIRGQALSSLLDSTNFQYLEKGKTALEELLHQPDSHARICALKALGRYKDPHYLPIILEHLGEESNDVRLQAVEALKLRSLESFSDGIIPVRFAKQIDWEGTESSIPKAVSNLVNDPLDQVRIGLLSILEKNNSPEALGLIVRLLLDTNIHVQESAADILVKKGLHAIPALLDQLETHKNAPANQSLVKAVLCRIDPQKYGQLTDEQVLVELKTIYTRKAQLSAIHELPISEPGILALCSFLEENNQVSLNAIFNLLAARHGKKVLQRITTSLKAQSSHTRANASEALETLISSSLVKLIIPLFDSNISVQQLAQIGANVWDDIKPANQAKVFSSLVNEPKSELTRALAVFALGESMPNLAHLETSQGENRRPGRFNLLDKLLDDKTGNPVQAPLTETGKLPRNHPGTLSGLISQPEARYLISQAENDPSQDVRAAAWSAARLAGKAVESTHDLPGKSFSKESSTKGEFMTASLSVIERIIFLKQVNLFESMTIEQLKVLASISEDELVPQGTVIFNEGDPGGVVYVIVHGRIGIERTSDRKDSILRLATLKARDSFGEMNLFDNSPRSASAIVVEDSLLLKLRAEPFLAIIHQHPDMSIELIKVLSMRIREANDQIAHLSRSTPRQLQKLYDKLDTTDDQK